MEKSESSVPEKRERRPHPVPEGDTLGSRIREARIARGLTQSELGGKDLTKGFVSQIERGYVKPSTRSLEILAARLGHDPHYFIAADPEFAPRRLELHLAAAEGALAQRRWPEAVVHAEAGLREADDDAIRARLHSVQAAGEAALGRLEQALEAVKAGLDAADRGSEWLVKTKLLLTEGRAYVELGQLPIAIETFERALDFADRYEVTDPGARTELLLQMGSTYRRLNRPQRARALLESALSLANSLSSLELAGEAVMGLAETLADAREMRAAISQYRRAISLFEQAAAGKRERQAMNDLAAVELEEGNLARAREIAEACLARADAAEHRGAAAGALITLARVALAEGEHDRATELATRAHDTAAPPVGSHVRADAKRVMGMIHEAKHERKKADAAFAEALEMSEKSHHRPLYASVLNDYADLLYKRGDADAAYRHLRKARELGTVTPTKPA